MRDAQKSRVYEAENVLKVMVRRAEESGNPEVVIDGITLVLPPEARFGNLESIQEYVDKVQAMPGVRKAFPRRGLRPVTVRHRKGDRHAHYEPDTATIAVHNGGKRKDMRELLVLHELAHHYSPAMPAHGPEFADAELTLVDLVMGPQAGLALRLLFAQHGVNCQPKAVVR